MDISIDLITACFGVIMCGLLIFALDMIEYDETPLGIKQQSASEYFASWEETNNACIV